MVAFMVFVFGLAVGSFLNAFIYRLELREGLVLTKGKHKPSVMQGRSFCPHCGHTLAWHDLIPLVSFLLLRGRCRYCKLPISWQYPLVEIATALLFVAVFSLVVENLVKLSFPQMFQIGYLWAIAALLIVIFVYDLKHYLIPDKLLFPAIGLALLWRGFEQFGFEISDLFWIWDLGLWISLPFVQAVLAGFGASAFFFAIYVLSNGRAMGFGDVKLAFLLGLFLGWPSILAALFFAFCLGAVVGLILIALKKKGPKSEVPFAPFLIAGTAIAFFFGSSIIDWYLGLFLV
ncbi:MAG: hypothetical protein A3C82_00690 [Candidatus Wildermuthbacteria bacterium RIFCSPHIGHO2_02_FULL_47_12]|uniref:Prepilin peptidase n=1 Tax=Candidatus Wildermuthbacteria bacterium RIFCSPHIGHO2_02_FULL_47_12 TaxID=1802451 RepID=A0A1G2R2Z5_9BACT|nr:MAG: hypothetical protein A3C82_00690 [Candidatus Wildermuthbacteria bacterium RIFCSPHIGHO2_02_FULL_47_12]